MHSFGVWVELAGKLHPVMLDFPLLPFYPVTPDNSEYVHVDTVAGFVPPICALFILSISI